MEHRLAGLPAFMLLRKSQADKEEEKRALAAGRVYDALANQRDALLALAERDGVVIPQENVFAEVRSGERLEARGEFQRLLAKIRALPQPGALLYVVNTARVSRGLLTERGMLQDLFIEQRVLVRTTNGFTDLSVADERLLYEFQGALAHHYLLRYKEDVARTRAVQVGNGRVRNGSVPYGYIWDKEAKEPKPHPSEFPVLKAICRDALTLSDRALEKKYGVPQSTIRTALTSPMICGYPAKTTGYRPGTKRVVYLPREEWVWPDRQGPYEAAISREDWERVQRVREGRQKARTGQTAAENAWCRDVVEFAEAPGRVRLGCYFGYGGRHPTYEREWQGRRFFVYRETVHKAVIRKLSEMFRRQHRETDWLTRLAQRPRGDTPQEAAPLEVEREREEKRAELMAAELTNPETGELTKRVLRQQLKESEERHRVLGRQIEALRSSAPMMTSGEEGRARALIKVLAADPEMAWWKEMSDADKRLAVRLFVQRAEVTMAPRPGTRGYLRVVRVFLAPWCA